MQHSSTTTRRTVHLPTKPSALGLPDYFDERYDPLWTLLSELEMPVCIHLGVEDDTWEIANRDPTPQMGVFTSQQSLRLSEQLGMLLLSGVLERFPRLRFVFVEPGLGWVPHYLQSLDRMYDHGYDFPALKEQAELLFSPTDVAHLHGRQSRRRDAARNRRREHHVVQRLSAPCLHLAQFPGRRDGLMDGVPTDEAYPMVYGNAARLFRL